MLTLTRFNSLARRNPTADDLMMRVTDDQSWINMHVISIPVCCWRPPFRQSDRARRADAGNGYSFRQYISFGPSSSASELEAIRPPLSLSGHGRRAGRRGRMVWARTWPEASPTSKVTALQRKKGIPLDFYFLFLQLLQNFFFRKDQDRVQ